MISLDPSPAQTADADDSIVAFPSRRGVLLTAAALTTGALLARPEEAWAATGYRRVTASVATLWTSPAAPRHVDAAATRPSPDIRAWLRALDALPGNSGRLGLHGRVDTQLQRHEPVVVLSTRRDGWMRVVAPWHPTRRDTGGYPGWLAPGQVGGAWSGATRGGKPVVTRARSRQSFLAAARALTGVPYLWGGASPLGVDCSGLVLVAARIRGVQVPRDANDQYRLARRVALSAVRPGDLYFFADPGKEPHHVGIVTRPGFMLNAPATGSRVREEPIAGARRRTLVGAGRFAGLS